MATKSLELSITDRLNELVSCNPAHKDAFGNYLTILSRAKIDTDHDKLIDAVQRCAEQFPGLFDHEVESTIAHISGQSYRSHMAA